MANVLLDSGQNPRGQFGSQLTPEMAKKIHITEERLQKLLNPLESHIMSIQGLLVWENARSSAAMFLAVNGLFWFATVTTYRVYFLIGMTGLVVVFVDMWKNRIWPEIRVPHPDQDDQEEWTPVHPHLMSVPEICSYLAEVWVWTVHYSEWLINMRKESPAKFCLLSSSCLGALAVAGTWIPGVMISYMTVMGIFLWPCFVYHKLLQRAYEKIEPVMHRLEYRLKIKRKRSKKSIRRKRKDQDSGEDHVETGSDTDMEEYTPSHDPVATAALAKVITDSEDEDGVLTPLGSDTRSAQNSDMDDLPSDQSDDESLMLGLRKMPSFDDTLLDDDSRLDSDLPSVMPSMDAVDNNSLASLEPGLLSPLPDIDDDKSRASSVSAADTDALSAELDQQMHFDPKHFRESSDSSDNGEEVLTEGLSFSDVQSPSTDQAEQAGGNLSSQTMTAVKQTVSSLMSSTISGLGKLSQSVIAAATSNENLSVMKDNEVSPEESIAAGAANPPDFTRKTSDDSDIADFELLSQEDFDNFENTQIEKKPTASL